MKITLDPLENAIASFDESLDYYNSELANGNPRIKFHFRAATIKAYEFTYQLVVKFIRRYIKLISVNSADVDKMTFISLICKSEEIGLVKSGLSDWLRYRKDIELTSQAYSEAIAQIFVSVPKFREL